LSTAKAKTATSGKASTQLKGNYRI